MGSSLDRTWQVEAISPWSLLAAMVGKVKVERGFLRVDGRGRLEATLRRKRWVHDLASTPLAFGRWAYANMGAAGTVLVLGQGPDRLRIGGEALLPDRRYDLGDLWETDLFMPGDAFLKLVSAIDACRPESGLDAGSPALPYRGAPTRQEDVITIELRKNPMRGTWKVPVAVIGSMVAACGVAYLLSTLSWIGALLLVLAGASLVRPIIARLREPKPARLLLGDGVLVVASRDGTTLGEAPLGSVSATPAVSRVESNPPSLLASLGLEVPGLDEITLCTNDTRLEWASQGWDQVRAPRYAVGTAELTALAAALGLGGALRFDRERGRI